MSDEKQMTWDELAAENSKLRAEVARLREACKEYHLLVIEQSRKLRYELDWRLALMAPEGSDAGRAVLAALAGEAGR